MSPSHAPKSIWWGRVDWLLYFPISLFLAGFWVYYFASDTGPVTESLHRFFGTRGGSESHSPWVMAGSMVIFFYSFTLFLRGRLLFGLVSRRWTIAAAILLILISACTAVAALLNYSAAFL